MDVQKQQAAPAGNRSEEVPAEAAVRLNEREAPGFATTLAKGLAVLEAFEPGAQMLGNGEIAARIGLPRPTVARLTHTLAELGYLRYSPKEAKYRLWARTLALAYPLLASMTVRQVARPLIQEFAESLRGAVSLGVLDGTNLVYVETSRTADVATHTPDIGSTVCLAQAAMGRALVSMLTAEEAREIEERIADATPEIWGIYGEALRDGIRQCMERGFCVSRGDWVSEVHAAGVPLFRAPGGECLAINCGIPAFRLRPQQLEEDVGPRLVALAGSIRALMEQRGAWRPDK